jgi:hypothetical protein
MLVTISLGLVLGSWASGLCGWILWSTRSYRRVRNMLVIYLAQLLVIASAVGSLLLLLTTLEGMGIGRTPRRDAAVLAYAASLVCGAFLAGRAEISWRRSVGLDKSLISGQQNKN